MFKHLLVPLDGSKLAEAVLPAARAWAERLHARLTLLHITEKNAPAKIHGEHHLASTREAETYLAALAATLARPGLAVQWHVHEAEASVAQMIVDQAAELKTDLIVLNTHGSSGLREKLLGSIAQHVLREGTRARPVDTPAARHPAGRAAHPEYSAAAGRRARARDGAADRDRAGRGAGRDHPPGERGADGRNADRRGLGAGVVLPNAMRAVLDLAQQGGVEYLQRVRATIPGATTADVARGDPAKMIAALAQKVNADLIIMATHGRMGLDAFWSASVAPKVLHEVVGPLLLVRAAER